MLADFKNWYIPEEESASDHNIMKFSIRLENILQFTKGENLIMAADSNSSSTSRNDNKQQGKKLEEFIANNNLHFINADNGRTNFQSSRGKSNIDIIITNN